MKTFVKGKTAAVAVCGLALAVAGAMAAKERLEAEIVIPGILADGTLFIDDDPLSGVGLAKISVNTKNGALRATVKGQAVNLSSKAQRFNNDPGVNAAIIVQAPFITIQNSKYGVGKPKKGEATAKARGSVKGSIAAI